MTTDPRKAHQELMTNEALSRRDEAVANIHRSRGIESEFTKRNDDAQAQEAERERLAAQSVAKDFEGTVTDRADAAGNVARDAAQANEGGIGVAASNSGPGQQDARIQSNPNPPSSEDKKEDKKESGADDESRSSVDIPEKWEALSWPERSALAKKIDPSATVRNGEDAERVIKTELARREKK